MLHIGVDEGYLVVIEIEDRLDHASPTGEYSFEVTLKFGELLFDLLFYLSNYSALFRVAGKNSRE